MDRHLARLPEIHGVEIGLQDPILGVAGLEHQRDGRLGQLARPRPPRVEENRAGDLLGDGAAALADLVALQIHVEGTGHRHRIDAGMGPEAPVFGGQHRVDDQPRHLLKGHPGLGPARGMDDADHLCSRIELDFGLTRSRVGKRVVPGGSGRRRQAQPGNYEKHRRSSHPSAQPDAWHEDPHQHPLCQTVTGSTSAHPARATQ